MLGNESSAEIPFDVDTLTLPLSSLGLARNVLNPLIRSGLIVVGDLLALTDAQIAALPRFGEIRYNLLRDTLRELGARVLRPYSPPYSPTRTGDYQELSRKPIPEFAPSLDTREFHLNMFSMSDGGEEASDSADDNLPVNLPTIGEMIDLTRTGKDIQQLVSEAINDYAHGWLELATSVLAGIQDSETSNEDRLKAALPKIRALRGEVNHSGRRVDHAWRRLNSQITDLIGQYCTLLEVRALADANPALAEERWERDASYVSDIFHIVMSEESGIRGAEKVKDFVDNNLHPTALSMLKVYYTDGASQEAIANVFGVSETDVQRNISRFRQLGVRVHALLGALHYISDYGPPGTSMWTSGTGISNALRNMETRGRPISASHTGYPDFVLRVGNDSKLCAVKAFALPYPYPGREINRSRHMMAKLSDDVTETTVGRERAAAAEFPLRQYQHYLVIAHPDEIEGIMDASRLGSVTTSILELVHWAWGTAQNSRDHLGYFAIAILWSGGAVSFHPPGAKHHRMGFSKAGRPTERAEFINQLDRSSLFLESFEDEPPSLRRFLEKADALHMDDLNDLPL